MLKINKELNVAPSLPFTKLLLFTYRAYIKLDNKHINYYFLE